MQLSLGGGGRNAQPAGALANCSTARKRLLAVAPDLLALPRHSHLCVGALAKVVTRGERRPGVAGAFTGLWQLGMTQRRMVCQEWMVGQQLHPRRRRILREASARRQVP